MRYMNIYFLHAEVLQKSCTFTLLSTCLGAFFITWVPKLWRIQSWFAFKSFLAKVVNLSSILHFFQDLVRTSRFGRPYQKSRLALKSERKKIWKIKISKEWLMIVNFKIWKNIFSKHNTFLSDGQKWKSFHRKKNGR